MSAVWLLMGEVTLILVLAAGAAHVLRNGPAAIRHLVWTSAMAALLVLAIGTPLPPAWTVEVDLPGVLGRSDAMLAPPPTTGELVVSRVQPDAGAIPRLVGDPVTGSGPAASAATWLIVLWFLGGALLLARLAGGVLLVAQVIRRASPVTDPTVLEVMADAGHAVGMHRPVRLLWLESESSPGTCGILRPTILLPPAARGWSRARLELVLVHELVHVWRADALTGGIAELARAALWIHPGVWLAVRRLGEERERACDEAVLRHGVRPTTYARELLSIARESTHSARAPVLTLAPRNQSVLERRIRGLLGAGEGVHRPVGPAAGLAVSLLVLLPAAVLACAEVTGPGSDSGARSIVPAPPAHVLADAPVENQDSAESGGADSVVEAAQDRVPVTAAMKGDGWWGGGTLLPPAHAWANDESQTGKNRLGCWGAPFAEGQRGHAVVVYFVGRVVGGDARIRLVPEDLEDGAGMASVRHEPGLRCWKAGVAGIRLAGRWGPGDAVTIPYSADSDLYYATAEGGIEGRIHPPAGATPFECDLTGKAADVPLACRPIAGGQR